MAAALSVAACSYIPSGLIGGGAPEVSPPPPSGPLIVPENPGIPMPQPVPVPVAASPTSNELRLYYARIARTQQSAGLLNDGSTVGANASPDQVARIFKSLAFRDEFSTTTRALQRWDTSLGVVLQFGPSVSEASRDRIKSQVRSVLGTVTDLTGLKTGTHPWIGRQLIVYVVNDGERMALAPTPAGIVAPGPSSFDIQLIQQMRRTDQCMVITYDQQDVRGFGMVIIREELPPILQLACIQEEITQALGLTNDSPVANPSIFNDDDQYATLTALDRRLLRLLYHPDLKPGMTLTEAGPIIDRITAQLPQEGA